VAPNRSIAGAGWADHVPFSHGVRALAGDYQFYDYSWGSSVLPEELSQTYQRLKDGWQVGNISFPADHD